VLINLSGNAVKFTAKGEVVIQIRQLARTGADTTLCFSVKDSGIGIAADKLAHIFTGFSQAEASTTRRFGGTGLGLSISRQLVTLMGGELLVDSVLGQGSTFHFTLTLPATELAADDHDQVIKAPTVNQRRLEGIRLLVVEDNLINQQVAEELLSNEGALIEIAANGQLGVAAVAAANPPFDAVLMDLQMPVMDGFEATRAIRTELGLTDLPIIAMTANAMASDRTACLAAGMNDHIGKPFNLPQLIQLLQSLTHATAGAPMVTPATTTPEGIDVAGALERLGGNTDLYARILKEYLSEIARLPDQLDLLLRDGDLAGAARLLHTLKGLSATVGASPLATVAREAESLVKGVNAKAALKQSELHARFRQAVTSTMRSMGEVARQFTQASGPAPIAPAQTTLDRPRTLAQLGELQALLKRANMRAVDVHAQLDSALAQTAPVEFKALNAAMVAFDFALAVVQCETLIQKLSHSP
jgi:CheY-like chemotaxis protein/HPt (histidine-containing phosphotransfer) domain-containing protein